MNLAIIGSIIVAALIVLVIRSNDEQSGVSEADFLEKEGRIQYDYFFDDDDCDGTQVLRPLGYILKTTSRKQALIAIVVGILGLFLSCVKNTNLDIVFIRF